MPRPKTTNRKTASSRSKTKPKKAPRSAVKPVKPTARTRSASTPPVASQQAEETYTERANGYARNVAAGRISAGKWVRLACQRHLNDLERGQGFPFRYSPTKAHKACGFIEELPHTKGKWARRKETIRLEPFQCFIICSLFGWVDKQTADYRFTEAYICLPRKNAKSTLAAAIGIYKFAADGEFGAEVYSGATTEKQAWEVFRPARLMVKGTKDLQEAYGITINAKSLTIAENGSRFEPLIGKPGDGASPSCAIVDEYHEHDTDDLYDTMKTGMGARENPLLLVITTAGSNRSGPCYALQIDCEKVLENVDQNERLFILIYSIDEKVDDWKSEAALRKANPNFGISVFENFLKDAQRDAINSARKQNIFKTKHLNVWVNADVAWMNMAAWEKCADPTLSIEQFRKQECFDAFDLASRVDIASNVRLFRRIIDNKTHYFIFARHYLNEDTAEGVAHYQGWAHENRLVLTPGNVTDYSYIADDLVQDARDFLIREVPHDPYQSEPLLQMLQKRHDWNKNVVLVAVDANVKNFSAPMKELEALVLQGRLHHDGDPVLAWMISNVVCHRDKKDNIYPNKQKEENKIDGAVALIMALARALMAPDLSSVYSQRGLRTL